MRRDPLRNGVQKLLHAIVLAIGWLLFFWAWLTVGENLSDHETLVWLIVATLVVSPVITLYWVLHNLSMFRRKGARLRTEDIVGAYTADWSGRTVVADWTALRAAPFTVIDIADARKTYTDVALPDPQQAFARRAGER
jgi:hypothetical protein